MLNARFGALLVAGLTCGGSLARADDDPARQRFVELVTRYRSLGAYSDQGATTVSSKIGGQPQDRTTPAATAFVRPSKLSVDAGEARLLDDGETLAVAVTPTRSFVVTAAPKKVGLATVSEGPVGALLLGTPGGSGVTTILALLLAENPADRLLEGGTKVIAGPDVTIDGKACPSLILDRPEGLDTRLAIDPESGLIREIEMAAAAEALRGRSPTGTEVADLKVVWKSGAIATENVDPSRFEVKPPAGYSKIAGLEQPKEDAKAQKRPVDALVGKPAPEFTLTVFDGKATKRVTKAELAGKVVMLDFWATWCAPCLAELPEIAKMIEAYQKSGKNVVIVAVSQDREAEGAGGVRSLIESTLAKKKIELNVGEFGKVAIDPGQGLGEAFAIEALPTIVILDPKGVVQAVHEGYSDDVREVLTAEIDRLLDGKPLAEPDAGASKKPSER